MERISKEELLRVLAAARARRERDFLMFLVAYCHALRRSEVVAIVRNDIYDGMLDVRRLKGSEHTIQPLLEDENPLLNERAALLDYVATMHGNQLIFDVSDRHLARLFAGYAEQAGIKKHKRHPHVLKHTCISELIKPAGISETQCWAGHKSGASTLLYNKMTTEEAAPAVLAALRS